MFSSASITGFDVEEAIQQPDSVQHVDHKDPEQQLGDGAPLSAALRRLRVTRREHGRNLNPQKNTIKKATLAGFRTRLFMTRYSINTIQSPRVLSTTASFRLSAYTEEMPTTPLRLRTRILIMSLFIPVSQKLQT